MYEPNQQHHASGAKLAPMGCMIQPRFAGTSQRALVRLPAAAFITAALAALIAASPDAAAQAAAPQPAANTFQAQAAQLGIKSCAPLFASLGESLTRGTTYASTAQAQQGAPNDHGAHAVVGMKYDTPNYKGQAAGVIYTAPTKAGGCEGNLVRVAPFPQSCPDVVRQLPQGSTLATTLSGTPLYNLGGNQGQALLVPSGAGCVVVTVASAMERR
ncbi:hypothetical protein [Cupriavidus cauae]|uniref:Uncharacterized protein n=1 Tax=Cupriavidus cauae TaxID=2608999 RepID=A0A5M8B5A5_9BURK|nr:hypothetical protein [Cupriavidus cauae]KAA6129626.1 hypothetical protein F1599_04970 [Cupriavidus cauae]